MQIRWSPQAVDDLERICDRIAADNPDAARRVATIIYNGCARLSELPRMDRTSRPMPGWRELIFAPLPYIVAYFITEEAVEIVRIFHGAQDWP